MGGIYKKVLIIDDDPCNNQIFTIMLKSLCKPHGVQIKDFTNPEAALKYITDFYTEHTVPTILFLDINMPVLSGWNVLARIDALPEFIKQCFTIYISSSSIDPADKKRASLHYLVKGYLEKPLHNSLSLLRKELLKEEAHGDAVLSHSL